MNVLSYTTATPNPCDETLNIVPGKPCMSQSTLKKLMSLEKELNINNPNPTPTTRDDELLPSDGSTESKMVRRLAAALDVESEYAILSQDVVKKVLTDNEIKLEKNRFKVPGPRLSNVGTDGEKHAYRTLLKWADLFDFFYPLPNAVYAGERSKHTLDVVKIMKIIEEFYPDIRVIASEITIVIKDETTCVGHAIVVLIDIRGDEFEEWTVEYFDASGAPPIDIIVPFMENMSKALRKFRQKLGHKGEVNVIPVTAMLRHQLTTTECGMHSLIYIRRRLEGINYKMFSKFKIPDSFAKEFRRDIFVL